MGIQHSDIVGGQSNRTAGSQKRESRRWFRFRRRKFGEDESGLALLEFALAAPVFFILVFSTFEIGIHYIADRLLNSAVDVVARQIRTGQIQATSEFGEDEFKEALCPALRPEGKPVSPEAQNLTDQVRPFMILFDCTKMLVDVRTAAEFGPTDGPGRDENGDIISDDLGFGTGGASTIHVVRAFYEWPAIIDFSRFARNTGYAIGEANFDVFGNGRVITASAAILTEPF